MRSLLLPALFWMTAAALAQVQHCEPRHRYTSADGAQGCLTALPLSQDAVAGRFGSVRQAIPPNGNYALAASPRVANCPRALGLGTTEGSQLGASFGTSVRVDVAMRECRRSLQAAAGSAVRGQSDCQCRLLIADGVSPMTAAELQAHQMPEGAGKQAAAAPTAPSSPEIRVSTPAATASREQVVAESQGEPPAAVVTAAELDAVRRQLAELQAQLAVQRAERPPAAGPGQRQRAHALVIGNGRYMHLGSLPNPSRDAEAMAAKLRGYGFEVDLVLDADRNRLVQTLAAFQQRAAGSDVNVLFFAGHGLQVAGVNYIVPVDMRGEGISAAGVRLSSVSLEDMLEYMPARTRIVFLDACRDNPVARSLVATRTVAGIGLAPVQGTTGTLISYATKDGAVAEDGRGRHSPYTEALLAHLDLPLDISVVLRRVREAVMAATHNRQQPWEYGSLVGEELVLSRVAR